MILTDKAKEDFENGIVEILKSKYGEEITDKENAINWIYESNNLILNAHIIEFFDSVGIYIGIDPLYDMQGTFRAYFDNYGFQSISRQEATEQAIIKANEIYNAKTS